jgi:hypothetical protein
MCTCDPKIGHCPLAPVKLGRNGTLLSKHAAGELECLFNEVLILKMALEGPYAPRKSKFLFHSFGTKGKFNQHLGEKHIGDLFSGYCEDLLDTRNVGFLPKDARKTFTQISHAEMKQVPQGTMTITGHTSAKLLDDSTYADLNAASLHSRVFPIEDLNSFAEGYIQAPPSSMLEFYSSIIGQYKENKKLWEATNSEIVELKTTVARLESTVKTQSETLKTQSETLLRMEILLRKFMNA